MQNKIFGKRNDQAVLKWFHLSSTNQNRFRKTLGQPIRTPDFEERWKFHETITELSLTSTFQWIPTSRRLFNSSISSFFIFFKTSLIILKSSLVMKIYPFWKVHLKGFDEPIRSRFRIGPRQLIWLSLVWPKPGLRGWFSWADKWEYMYKISGEPRTFTITNRNKIISIKCCPNGTDRTCRTLSGFSGRVQGERLGQSCPMNPDLVLDHCNRYLHLVLESLQVMPFQANWTEIW